MTNFFNGVMSSNSISIHFIKENILISLTPIQKKVALVALAFLSCFVAIYFSYHFCMQDKKVSQSNNDFPEDFNLTVKNNNHLSEVTADLPKSEKKTIAERLEKNRKYAQDQQDKEHPKGFSVDIGDLPEKIRMWVPYEGRVDRNIQAKEEWVHSTKLGIASCQGFRSSMEDADLAVHDSFKVKELPYAFDVFGIFDGHGGAEASDFVKKHLVQYLKFALEQNNLETLTDEGIFKALKSCFQNLDTDYKNSDGTTATVAIIINGNIWVANVGDSRTILTTKDGKVIQASEDAKPNIERYRKKIEKLGGTVTLDQLTYRVNGILAVARSVGDHEVKGPNGKCSISASPKITCFPLKDFSDGHLVLACDGLYDVAITNEVGAAINKMASNSLDVKDMAHRLVYHAISSGSKDNVSVMVVKL